MPPFVGCLHGIKHLLFMSNASDVNKNVMDQYLKNAGNAPSRLPLGWCGNTGTKDKSGVEDMASQRLAINNRIGGHPNV